MPKTHCARTVAKAASGKGAAAIAMMMGSARRTEIQEDAKIVLLFLLVTRRRAGGKEAAHFATRGRGGRWSQSVCGIGTSSISTTMVVCCWWDRYECVSYIHT